MMKHKPVDRYEPPKITPRRRHAENNERQYVAALQEIPIKSLTRNENPLKKLERINHLQLSKINRKSK